VANISDNTIKEALDFMFAVSSYKQKRNATGRLNRWRPSLPQCKSCQDPRLYYGKAQKPKARPPSVTGSKTARYQRIRSFSRQGAERSREVLQPYRIWPDGAAGGELPAAVARRQPKPGSG